MPSVSGTVVWGLVSALALPAPVGLVGTAAPVPAPRMPEVANDAAAPEAGDDAGSVAPAERSPAGEDLPSPEVVEPVDTAQVPPPRTEPNPETLPAVIEPINEPQVARDPLAVGLMVAGGLLIGGGATLVGLGVTLEPRAQERYENRPEDADEQYWRAYRDTERQRGIVFMAMGGVFGAAGIGLMTWGAVRYVRHRRQQRSLVSWMPMPGGGGFSVQGRF